MLNVKYTDSDLAREITRVIDDTLQQRQVVHPQVVTLEVCRAHRAGLVDDENNVDVAFFQFTSYTLVRKITTAVINRIDAAENESTSAPWLPGFDHLQPNYVICRDGVDVMVPVEDATDEELSAKAAMFRSNARKLVAHANELDRYIVWREQSRNRPDSTPEPPQPSA